MDVDFTDEQTMLRDSAARLFDSAPAAKRWPLLARAGFLAIPFDEEIGGMGGGAVEMMVLLEEAGKALAGDPLIGSLVLPAELLRGLPDRELAGEWSAGVASGALRLALAHDEPDASYGSALATTARRDGDRWILVGEKAHVEAGEDADIFIVSAGTPDGLALFRLDPATPGLRLRGVPGWDDRTRTRLSLDDVSVPAASCVAHGTEAERMLARAQDFATAAACAEAVGLMDAALKLTIDYLRTRKQFRVPLASFQVLQHRAVDMLTALEQARSAAMAAASACATGSDDERARVVAQSKVQVNKSARFIGQAAVQAHGGIGLTEEYRLGAYFKRLTMLCQSYGDERYHLRRLAG